MNRENSSSPTLRVALALLSHDYEDDFIQECIEDMGCVLPEVADLLVLPEGSMPPRRDQTGFVSAVRSRAAAVGIPTCGSAVLNDGSIAAAIASPEGNDRPHLYFKHTAATRLAFHFPDWLSSWKQAYLRPIAFEGATIGLTLCHDQTLSLLQRYLALRGADVLINPSFGHINPSHRNKWATWLRARAIENGVPVLCTMFGMEENARSKGYAFAFDPHGRALPLEFVPSYEDVESFTADDPWHTRVTLDGVYVARVPPRLNRPALPQDPGPAGSVRLTVVARGKSTGSRRLDAEIDPEGECVMLDPSGRPVVLVPVPGSELLRPEAVSRRLMQADRRTASLRDPFFVIVSAWNRPCPPESTDHVETLAKARAMEHACVVALVGALEEGTRVYSVTRNRVPREPERTASEIPIDLDLQKQQRGGPKWFFSRRDNEDFSNLRPHYLDLLAACEEAAR